MRCCGGSRYGPLHWRRPRSTRLPPPVGSGLGLLGPPRSYARYSSAATAAGAVGSGAAARIQGPTIFGRFKYRPGSTGGPNPPVVGEDLPPRPGSWIAFSGRSNFRFRKSPVETRAHAASARKDHQDRGSTRSTRRSHPRRPSVQTRGPCTKTCPGSEHTRIGQACKRQVRGPLRSTDLFRSV